MASITLTDIVKRYGSFEAIPDLNLDIVDGEFLVLLGPSGCGKTTTMRMIAGLEEITAGRIAIGDRIVNDLPPKDRDVAMVFQNYGLYPHMNVERNIGYPLKLRGYSSADRAAHVREVAEKVELVELLKRRPGALSGGQRQRVALARALVRTPQVFLMDEPLSNLDAKLRVSMRAELKHLHHELGVTTVYVTHDQMEAMTLASRIAVMNEGRIVQLDTPEAIYSDPADLFVANFIGSPSMNLVTGSITDGVFEAPGCRVPGMPIDSAANVVLGVRPEDLDLSTDAEAHFQAPLYALELTGEATLATIRPGRATVCARGPARFRHEINAPLGMNVVDGRIYLFDASTGARLRPAASMAATRTSLETANA